MNTRPTRFETLAGALAVLAWLIAVIVIEGSGDRGDETPAELLAYFEGNEPSIYFGGMLFFVGSALMIWFGGRGSGGSASCSRSPSSSRTRTGSRPSSSRQCGS